MSAPRRRISQAGAVLAIAFLFSLLACAVENGTGPNSPPTPSTQINPEAQALTELTRLVAIALHDQGLRMRLLADLQRSPFRERKLHFSSYLAGDRGGLLRTKIIQASGLSEEWLSTLLAGLPPLEFYMPVPGHRATWDGGATMVVASTIHDHELPAAFRTSGEPYVLTSAYEPPSIPVLALVPAETDFTSPPRVAYSENCGPEAPEECDDPTGGGGPNWPSLPSGLYVTKMYIPGDYEGFLKGEPEYEIHLHRPPGSDPNEDKPLRCVAESLSGDRHYAQNSETWEGAARIATEQQNNNQMGVFGDSVGNRFIAWEDDDTTCTIRFEDNKLDDLFYAVGISVYYGAGIAYDFSTGYIIGGLLALNTVYHHLASIINTNDELVGTFVMGSCSAPSWTGNAKILVDTSSGGTQVVGCARIVGHDG